MTGVTLRHFDAFPPAALRALLRALPGRACLVTCIDGDRRPEAILRFLRHFDVPAEIRSGAVYVDDPLGSLERAAVADDDEYFVGPVEDLGAALRIGAPITSNMFVRKGAAARIRDAYRALPETVVGFGGGDLVSIVSRSPALSIPELDGHEVDHEDVPLPTDGRAVSPRTPGRSWRSYARS
ncbi:MAG: hypothetical protein AAGB93_21220, partial [Planctomycetota bacterium]